MGVDLTGLGAVAGLVEGVVNRLWPDAAESDRQKMALALAEIQREAEILKAQAGINLAEAGSPSLFASGWRPAIGWSIAAILAYSYILYPLLAFALAAAGSEFRPPSLALDESLWQLMLGMLGLAAGRTVEKIKGASK